MKKILLTFAMFAAVAGQAFAQGRTVKGRVLDATGEGVVGATVMVKGTKIGTATDVDGNYTIQVPEGSSTLKISSMNFTDKEISISDNGTVSNVTMSEDAKKSTSLIGTTVYGQKIDKRTYVGAVNQVKAEDIAKRPVTSVASALDGAAPGVLVTSGGGQPGNSPDIQLRGQGSLSASSAPLIVLDGAPYSGSLSSINPLDIQEMTVLKDATSKAVYGSRAANGVILITTKRGTKSDKPRISLDASVGIYNRMIPEYERVTTKDYYELAWQGYANNQAESGGTADSEGFVAFLGGYNSYNVANSQLMIDGKVNPNASLLYEDDWQKELLRTGIRQNYNLSVSNGDNKSDYYFSVGYTKDQGIIKNSDYSRITALLNVNSQINSWLKSGFKLQTTYDEQKFFLGSGTAYSNPFFSTRDMGAIYPVYRYDSTGTRMTDANGDLVYDFGANYDRNTPGKQVQERPFGTYTNSVAALTYNKPSTVGLTGNGMGYLEAKFLKDFVAKMTFSVNYYSGITTNFYNSIYGDASNVGGRMSKANNTNLNYTFNQFITYTPSSGIFDSTSNHSMSVTIGHEAYNLLNKYMDFTRTGFVAPGFYEGEAAAVGEGSTSFEDRRRIETYFAQVNYDYLKRYYISGSVSRNGSSRFSPDVRWGTFGSAGAGWILSEESFMENTKSWLDLLKVRASWGITGNDQINALYGYLNQFGMNHNATNPGLVFNAWGNNDLKWEGMVDLNAGVDLSLKKGMYTASIDVYQRGSNALLYVQPLASSTGSTGYYANVGAMRNKGIEAQIGAVIIRNEKPGSLQWNVKLNLAHNRNAMTEVQGQDDTILGNGTILTKGLAVNSFYMAEYAGVNDEGQATYYTGQGYESVTTDYAALTSSDYRVFGSSFRDIDGSLTSNWAYKNFDLSVLFSFGIGGKFYDGTYAGLMGGGNNRIGNALHVDMLNSWKEAGDELNSDVPKFSYGNSGSLVSSISNRYLISNSFFNIKNVTLGYTFNSQAITKAGFTNLRLYASSENLFIKAARKGVDPNVSFFGSSSFSYFPARTFVFGVNLGL